MNDITWQPGMTLEYMEKLVIEKAMRVFQTKTQVAQALGISIRTLQNKLNSYAGLPPEAEPQVQVKKERKQNENRAK